MFLHPDQRAVVFRRFDGPARVRGSAGTGKTVVGLHRAAALAIGSPRRKAGSDPVHHVHQQLAAGLRESLRAASGGRPRRAVEFINIDKLATRLCAEAGQRANVSTRDRDAAYANSVQTGSASGHSTRRCRVLSVLPAG